LCRRACARGSHDRRAAAGRACDDAAGLPARAPLGDPYIQVTIPPIAHPDKTMLLMTGEAPMGYLAPSFPPQIPIVRIDGWMIQPQDGSKLTAETRKRVEPSRAISTRYSSPTRPPQPRRAGGLWACHSRPDAGILSPISAGLSVLSRDRAPSPSP
jgi:hypothetical protein